MSVEEKPSQDVSDLVVVGASAGGIGALSVLVGSLREDFPAPVVLAQHLDPQRPSNLGAVLERRSTLPVVVVSEGEPTKLEAGKVYVVPSNRHVRITDGHVELERDHAGRPRPSVDLLLSSAAHAFGEHLIAVVLTGSGSDGAAGAVEVKEAGGTVIIQNPETAQYPSMPQSLPPTAVDHVAELEQIGPLLYDLIRGFRLAPHEKVEDPLRDLLAQVSRLTNVDFRNYKLATIMRRLARRMAVTHNGSVHDYAVYLDTHPEEVQELVRAFLIKVTGFFRDPEAFELLRTELLPELIERGRTQGRVLRFWSAGCSTGEEPYSLALLIADLLGPELPEWSVKIFATDLDEHAVNFARRGVYPPNVLAELPADYRERFFETADHGFRVSKAMRQLVIFGHQDLARGVPFPRIDLVLCRNLLIYLKPEMQQTILDLFAYSLHPSAGYLFLGKAETARPTRATFESVNKKWKIYRCTSGPLALTTEQSKSLSVAAPVTQFFKHLGGEHGHEGEGNVELELAQMRRLTEKLLRYLPLGVVVIDRAYRIIAINGNARRLLGIREASYDVDFLHTVRGLPYAQVRGAIDEAFRDHIISTLNELEMDPSASGDRRFFNITITLMQVNPLTPELAVLSITDATEQVQIKRRLEVTQAEQTQLVQELSNANRRLTDINKELQDANEELQATNEELMLTQEELQATNEEFEATNEELQATNEELETNNEELQATNEEFEATNGELTARTQELEELAREVAAEQARFAQAVEHAPFNIMVLKGPGLIVEAISPTYARFFESRHIVGQSFDNVFAAVDGGGDFITLVRQSYREDRAFTTPRTPARVPNPDGEQQPAQFIHYIAPISDGAGKVDGVIIYSENVTERDEREAEGRR